MNILIDNESNKLCKCVKYIEWDDDDKDNDDDDVSVWQLPYGKCAREGY